MTDKILKELPEILVEYKCDIRKASRDDTNKQVMTESKIEVIDFDKIPNVYSREEVGVLFQSQMMHCIRI